MIENKKRLNIKKSKFDNRGEYENNKFFEVLL